jgi:hypothetical protein
VLVAEGREALDVLVPDDEALASQVLERALGVDGVPEQDAVDDQPEGAELVLLPLAVGLVELAASAVEDGAGERVAALAAVELDLDAPP